MNSASKFLVVSIGILGFACGWLWRGQATHPAQEAPAPAQRQQDGSLVLERQQGGAAAPAAPHAIPAGSKEERRVQVVVKPKRGVVVRTAKESSPVPDHSAGAGNKVDSTALRHLVEPHDMVDSCDCPTVTVDLSLVRMPDQSRRVVASSLDGVVLSGLDIPLEPIQQATAPLWIASGAAMLDASVPRFGAMLQHRRGPVVVGAGLLISPIGSNPVGMISAGLTW